METPIENQRDSYYRRLVYEAVQFALQRDLEPNEKSYIKGIMREYRRAIITEVKEPEKIK